MKRNIFNEEHYRDGIYTITVYIAEGSISIILTPDIYLQRKFNPISDVVMAGSPHEYKQNKSSQIQHISEICTALIHFKLKHGAHLLDYCLHDVLCLCEDV